MAGYAQSKYSNEFLSLGLGARGLAMSNTMCALTDDVTSAYWNPAGLTRMDKRYQLALMPSISQASPNTTMAAWPIKSTRTSRWRSPTSVSGSIIL